MVAVVVHNPDQLIEAIRYTMRFEPENSLVVASIGARAMTGRIDLPSEADWPAACRALQQAYGQYPNSAVAIVVFSEQARGAAAMTRELSSALQDVGVSTMTRLWASTTQWRDFDHGIRGFRDPAVATAMAAEFVGRGLPTPAKSRAEVEAGFHGDTTQLATALKELTPDPHQDHNVAWTRDKLAEYRETGFLWDATTARIINNLQDPEILNEVALSINGHNAADQAALFKELTSRTPQDHIEPVATLAALTAWVAGDGSAAWMALGRIPGSSGEDAGNPHTGLAGMIATCLQDAIPPSAWDDAMNRPVPVPHPMLSDPAPRRPAASVDPGSASPRIAPSR